MMISTKGRYALRVLIDLAQHQTDGYLPLKEIAARQDISEKYLESILKTLVHNKILVGMRGKGGGYRLTHAPEEYTVYKILMLTEENLAPVACLGKNAKPCAREAYCPTLPMWKELHRLTTSYLDGITIADLAKQPHTDLSAL